MAGSLFLSSCSLNGSGGSSGGSSGNGGGSGGGSTTQFTLTVELSGSGNGTVTSTPSGINCGASCSATFAGGAGITLQATAATGSTFSGWSGACAGTGSCTVTMSQNSSVTASFATSGGAGQKNFTVDLGAQGLAVDQSGNIWVASNGMGNAGQNVVTKLSSVGAILGTYGLGSAVDPCCLAIDSLGNIWAAGTPGAANGPDAVAVLEPNGAVSSYYSFPETYAGITDYASASAVTIDHAGNQWFVAGTALQEATIVDTVQELADGKVSTFDVGIGGASCVMSMAIDAANNRWFGSPCGPGQANSSSTDTVFVLTSSGQVVSFPVGENYDAGSPVGIGIDQSSDIWVTDPADDSITKLTWQGGFNPAKSPTSSVYPTIHTPMQVAIDASGNVWVGGTGGITELSASGKLLQTYNDNPLDSGVEGLAIDASGNVWASTVASASGASSGVVELTGAATGPQYFPYSGPVWP